MFVSRNIKIAWFMEQVLNSPIGNDDFKFFELKKIESTFENQI